MQQATLAMLDSSWKMQVPCAAARAYLGVSQNHPLHACLRILMVLGLVAPGVPVLHTHYKWGLSRVWARPCYKPLVLTRS